MAVKKDKIDEVLEKLPDELQDGVLKFAESLLQTNNVRDAKGCRENGTLSIRAFFGMWDSGDPRSADNDRIDSDLAGIT